MATIITPPAAYSSVRRPVVFEIDRDDTTLAEVSVNGYVKSLPKNAYSVNVSSYCRGDFDPQPHLRTETAFELHSGYDFFRVTDVAIAVDGVSSAEVPLIDAAQDPAPNRVMSDLKRRSIARGQMDEIPVCLTAPAVMECLGMQVEIGEGVWFVSLRVPDDAPERFAVRLLSTQGAETDRIDYEAIPAEGVRLAWVNPFGAIDYWSFPHRIKSATKITKERIYSESGYIPTSVQAEATQTISTGALPERLIDALSRVCMSEKVWRIEGEKSYPVDITSESVTTYAAEKLCALEVTYRDKIRML